MKGIRLVLVSILALAAAATVGAQRTSQSSRPLTNAQLQAKVRALQDENATLKRNYDLLLASCQSPAERDAHSQAEQEVAQALPARPRNVEDDLWRIMSVDYGVTENTAAFMRYGWKVTIRNGLNRSEVFDLTVQFLDKNGLVIDSGKLGVQTIGAYDEQTLTGDVMIRMPAAMNVASAKAIANRRR